MFTASTHSMTFKTDMKPVFDEYRAETLRAEKEKAEKDSGRRKFRSFSTTNKEYHRKLDAERELEMKLRREGRQQLRQSWANEPEPEKNRNGQ